MSRLVLVLRHPCLKDLYQFWLRLCDGETLPMAGDLDLAAMRPWLDDLAVVDVVRNDSHFTYTYCGYGLQSVFGADVTGHPVGDGEPAGPVQALRLDCDQVVREHIPLARVCNELPDDGDQAWERLVLPLFDEEGQVEKLLLSLCRLSPSPVAASS